MFLDSSCYNNGLSLEAGNSLVKASISVMPEQLSPRTEAILLGSLFSVTSLELQFFQAMAFLDNELDKFPMFDNLRTLSLSYCFFSERDADKLKALGRFLHKSPNLEELILQDFWYSEGAAKDPRMGQTSDQSELKTLPKVSMCRKGKAKLKKTYPQFGNLVRFQCRKLKYTEIIHEKGVKIQELVSFLLDISGSATKNNTTLTKV
ncbi:MEIOTIC F-BOX protein MOF [Setaria viridis]|uniref:FBD domain-containing protein n=1 Tax=Setaria viridis TaxID=4556 RepID=A0A4U6VJM8_SETVI|nr:MEIOTIC F-BOX protein MOF-like [Setaria viridis]TKW29808.1 hypothetical protein SEVIR_3G419701v2 [Setaria viridis]